MASNKSLKHFLIRLGALFILIIIIFLIFSLQAGDGLANFIGFIFATLIISVLCGFFLVGEAIYWHYKKQIKRRNINLIFAAILFSFVVIFVFTYILGFGFFI